MALILKKLFKGYFWLMEEKRDPRVDEYFLMSSPFKPMAIGLVYLYLIKDFLPKYMKNRQPFKLDKVLIAFNLVQVLVNAYTFFVATLEVLSYNWICQPIDYAETPNNMYTVKMVYVYFLTKLADLLDTVFFLLRGKNNQVSFLHVYHHFGMILIAWFGVKFFAGGHSVFIGWANSLVHTVMYFYYFMTIWNPEYTKTVWWKKHITHLQLLQFLFFFVMFGQQMFLPDCDFPKIGSYIIVPQSMFMMILFGDFYWKTYIKKRN